jgi:N-methylhydantoinase B
MATNLKIATIPHINIDPVTLDIIENALKNTRYEMDAVLYRTAMSPVIREQHDEFPMITDPHGRMIVGQFGSYIAGLLDNWDQTIEPGDVILLSDPYLCGGAISHINDLLVMLPIFYGEGEERELIGWASMFGHAQDVGGPLPGSLPTTATTIFGEGLRLPPVKIYERGKLNRAVLDIMLNNVRQPEMNRADLMAIIAGCRTAEKRVIELCNRFGKDVYLAATQALLDRTYRAMKELIVRNLPEEPQSFEDYVDDDGLGNGPFKMKLTIWREGHEAYFDWTGTDPQAMGPINFYLNESMFKMFIGVYLIMVFDPQILFNDGFYPLLHVTMPKGSLIQPEFPAALGCRTHALTRLFDVLGGALAKTSAGIHHRCRLWHLALLALLRLRQKMASFFYLMEINYGGIPGRPIGDGMDGHSWWPLFTNIPTEYLESYYPIRIDATPALWTLEVPVSSRREWYREDLHLS